MSPIVSTQLRITGFAAVCLLILTLAAACGGRAGPATPTTSPTITATAPLSPSPTTPAVASPTPATATATPTPTQPAPPGPTPTSSATPPTGTRWYEVQQGDTLFSLANRFGTTVAALAALNGLSDPSMLRAGTFILVPSSAPTATATAPPATPTAPPGSGPSRLIRHGSRSSTAVALTFDMGGRVDPAIDIMNWLIANNVKATIFPTGSMVESQNTDAGRQVLALVAAYPQLFELGNHSYSHPDFTTIGDAEIRQELARTEAAVAARTSLTMRPRFRPPFGGFDSRVLAVVGAAGYGQTVMWDIDTIDWRPEADGGPTAAEISAKVVANALGGSIVLMHLGGFNTLDALPAMVQGLRDRGYQFVRISELPLD